MKKRSGPVVGALIFLLLLGVALCSLQNVLKLNMTHRGTYSVNGFYQEKENTVDAVFIGASTMFCTVDPLVLYEEYGITSYDFCSSAQALPLSCLFVEEAVKRQRPKVVVLEVLSAAKTLDDEAAQNLDYGLTDLPLSVNKVREVFGMFPGDAGAALSHLIPMVTYKDRWKELTREDFTGETSNYSKGAYTPDKTADAPLDFSYYYQDEEKEVEIPAENMELFRRMKQICEDNGAKLLLLKSPSIGWTRGESMAVQELADELGLPFVNYFDELEDLQLDMTEDFRDNSHLNRNGSRKVSIHMGDYLTRKYQLADHRGEDMAASWDEALRERAHDRMNESISRSESFDEMLAKIKRMENATVAASISGDGIYMQDQLSALAQSFSLNAEELARGGSFCIENSQCKSAMIHQGDPVWEWENGDHTMVLTGYTITMDRQTYGETEHGITILAYDNRWQKVVSVAGFAANDPEKPIYYYRQEAK